jgi:porphobilinogen synthase
MIVYDSVWSPTFSTANDSDVDSPGRTAISSCANHTCTDTSATLPRRSGRRPDIDPDIDAGGHVCAHGAVRTMPGMASISADFPRHRPRRLRTTPAMRDLVAETNVAVTDLIAPLFVREGIDERIEITSLPGVFQETRDSLCREVAGLAELGVRAVMLFGVPATKDPTGSGASDPDGIVQVALADLRAEVGDDVVLIADLCVDEYTSHGHCGIVGDDGRVDNDATLELYAAAAVAQATAGAQVVAPSGMMDGQVGVIRAALDDHGFTDVAILAYAAKYASGLYGPFRDAVDVTIADGGDRKGYQQDFRNAREALVEVRADLAQGADMVMVKPALSYLDVIHEIRRQVDVPLAAYHVSGEYSMIKAAAANGWIDHDVVALEQLTAVKRAGADIILTYLTRWFAERATGKATA